MRIIKIAKMKEKDRAGRFYEQYYSDNDGEWKVPDIFNYVKENGKKVKIPIEKLLHNLDPQCERGDERADEISGTPEFIERANEADLSYPLIVIKYPNGLEIADGIHRLWKAKNENLKMVNCYLIDSAELENIEQSEIYENN